MKIPHAIQRTLARDILADNELLIATLQRILTAAEEIDQKLDDPHGDGSGDDAESPTGDDYNDLYGTIVPLARDALAKVTGS